MYLRYGNIKNIMEGTKQLFKEHQWMVKNSKELEKHRGKWIAILDENVIMEGNSYLEVFRKIKEKYPKRMPLITYILNKDEEQMIALCKQ